ncbi:transketolase [Aquisalinus flavus]|uniref:Transketolase n=2 Tax=Aquisalinus flavus TaxID=1526572 RepID=A0A8J2Y3R1_9PROT|nr:transketolase [Aquisalinus flavus]
MTDFSPELQKRMSAAIATLSMDAVEQANSGHPGMPMGMADVATTLFTRFLKFDASAPNWPDRDRFVLSAGHGSMLIYSLSYLNGYQGMTIDDLKNFRQLGSKTAGHPEYGHVPGVETTTGPLGQGFGNAVGMAIAEAHCRARYGEDICNHFTYTIAGDGCLMEGISQEALSLAGHLKLNKLIVLWDDNNITIDGAVSLADSTDQLKRFEASGWDVTRVDGHDMEAVAKAIEAAQKSDTPSLIACKTVIGKGANKKAGTKSAHGAPLGAEEIAFARTSLDWTHEPFDVPSDVLDAWRQTGQKGAAARGEWDARMAKSDKAAEYKKALSGDVKEDLRNAISQYISGLIADPKKVATRKASEMALEVINEAIPFTLGGSADLTGSNNTKTSQTVALTAEDPTGRYIHYGIREHGMAAMMNGMALHGGVIPYSGGFLIFSDYCRPSLRLAALMGIRVIHVLTHDSIGLGEDGPTHQPVEHMSALRAIPNFYMFRPCDVVETAECWEVALNMTDKPSGIALTRQNLTQLRTEMAEGNPCEKGGYILSGGKKRDVTLIASGSEVELAMEAKTELEKDGVTAAVVSVPCLDLFMDQDDAYIADVLGDGPRVVAEAGIQQSWDRIIYTAGKGKGAFVGMTGFGASGKGEELFEHFGITSAAIAAKAKELLS